MDEQACGVEFLDGSKQLGEKDWLSEPRTKFLFHSFLLS